jgi:hypothetical protein
MIEVATPGLDFIETLYASSELPHRRSQNPTK